MADKDDDFMDSDEGEAGGAKEATKAKAPFASAMLLQVLKWVAIIVGFILLTVTISVVVFNVLGGAGQTNDRVSQSPEYITRPPELDWYTVLEEMRGFTNDVEGSKRMYTIKINLGFEKGNKEFSAKMATWSIPIQDRLLTWLSQQSAEYLGDINNRDAVRETIRQQVNQIMDNMVEDVRFTKFEILNL